MATTLATEKQSHAIKQRMAEIRTGLPYSADAARARVRQLTDWKFHMSRHPWPILATVAAAGYLLVPHKRSRDRNIVHHETPSPSATVKPVERGMLASIASAVTTLAVKQAKAVAANHLTGLFMKRGSR